MPSLRRGGTDRADYVDDPTFRIAFLFHDNIELFRITLVRCLEALTHGTDERFEVVVHCDGTPGEVGEQVLALAEECGVDEVRMRSRGRYVASGDPSNNGHRRLFDGRSRYLIVVEDDVVMYRTEPSFDVLAACRELFEHHPNVVAISKVNDHGQWTWPLCDLGDPIDVGIRSVNRLSTHFVAYDAHRFLPIAQRFGGFDLDVFIDRPDLSYNWEDLVSHVGTTGGRQIAFADGWPIDIFHCDRKIEPGSIYHTQDPSVKASVLAELEQRYRPSGRSA